MLDLWEHMAFADVSVSLFPSVTELNGWKRTIKVAVTCHCMEVSTTSALPAVSGATGAWHDLKHFFILVGADRAWEMFEALLRGAFCKFMAAGWYFLPCSALQLQEAQKKGHFTLSVLPLIFQSLAQAPDALHILPLGVLPSVAWWGFFYSYSKLIVALITGSRWCFAVVIWYFPPEALEEDVIQTAG